MTPELRLVAACCRWPQDEEARDLVLKASIDVSDWERVTALTAAHRVEGLTWHALEAAGVPVPTEARATLQGMAAAVRASAVGSISETLRVCDVLQRERIDFRIIKGLPLAVLAYRTIGLKNSIDVDLLVQSADVVRAATLLTGLGYECMRPHRPLDEKEFASWSGVAKEAWFVSSRGQVDLHWDLLDQPYLLAGLDPWADPKMVKIFGKQTVPTLPDAAHLAYLAAHGAMSGWSRLKWIADFAAFLQAFAPDRRRQLCDEARTMTGGRPIDQALILAERLFGDDLLKSSGEPSEPARGLAETALTIIRMRKPGVVLEKEPRAWRLISRSQWRLRQGASYRWREASRRFREQEIRFRLRWPVPPGVRWLYWPLRLPGALAGAASRAFHKRHLE